MNRQNLPVARTSRILLPIDKGPWYMRSAGRENQATRSAGSIGDEERGLATRRALANTARAGVWLMQPGTHQKTAQANTARAGVWLYSQGPAERRHRPIRHGPGFGQYGQGPTDARDGDEERRQRDPGDEEHECGDEERRQARR